MVDILIHEIDYHGAGDAILFCDDKPIEQIPYTYEENMTEVIKEILTMASVQSRIDRVLVVEGDDIYNGVSFDKLIENGEKRD
jgi:hypothetical protein